MNRRLTIAVLLTGATAVLAACSGPTPGSPAPATSAGGSSAGPAPSSTGGSAADPLASVDPCSLIPPAELTKNGMVEKGPTTEDGARTCVWNQNAAMSGPGFSIGVRLYEHYGLDQIRAGAGAGNQVSATQVGKHQAVEIKYVNGAGAGGCAVALGVSPSTSVFVNADDGGGNLGNSCNDASQAAIVVEQHIPAATR